MTLAPLVDAPFAVQLHVATVVPAAMIGPVMFWSRKGTPIHRLLGKVWLGLMAVAALSSFFIHSINMFMGFSPIHLISIYVLVGCYLAYRSARAGRIASHKRQVIGLYAGGIVGAGAFTLLPGRLMNEIVFGSAGEWARPSGVLGFFATMAVVLALLFTGARMMAVRKAAERI